MRGGHTGFDSQRNAPREIPPLPSASSGKHSQRRRRIRHKHFLVRRSLGSSIVAAISGSAAPSATGGFLPDEATEVGQEWPVGNADPAYPHFIPMNLPGACSS
jgi:hypothetical protein